ALGLFALALAVGRDPEPAGPQGAADLRTGPGGPPRLLVVGVDAVGFEIFARYRDAMPHLAAFADTAAHGRLVPAPPYLSPAIWTSIATGLPTEEHHVGNYELYADLPGMATIPIDRFYSDPATALGILPAVLAWRAGWLSVLPTTRLHRRGQPFWQATDASVGVVCWPATWPVEPQNGLLVSDRWPPDRSETLFHYRADLPGQVWPPRHEATLAPFKRSPAEPPDGEVLAMAPFTAEEVDAFHAALHDDLAAPKDQPFSNLHYAWLSDRSCLGAARWMLEVQQPELAVVYLLGPDLMGHAFLPDADGLVAGFDETDARRLAAVYPAFLRRLDQDLAWLLAAAGPETRTVVLADHGMAHQGTGLFSVWHAGDGLVLAQGPGLAPGEDLGRRPAEGWLDLLTMPAPGAHDTSPE
ncbi:MAG: alkaline phosphatase family protein, partial [Pseudomonadota bacterium]